MESEPSAPGAFRAQVAAATEGLGAAVDQSSGRSVIRFAGAPARSVLATCCRLDLHPRAFGPGSAAMTRIAHVACGIRLADATPTFDLIVGSTYARWLIEELLEASARYGVRFEPALEALSLRYAGLRTDVMSRISPIALSASRPARFTPATIRWKIEAPWRRRST